MTASAVVVPPAASPPAGSTAALRRQARRAGLLYAAGCISTPFALLYVPRAILVTGDPAATAERLRAARGLVELGIAAEVFSCALVVVALVALYRLFRGVSEPLAMAMVALFLVAIPLQLANLLTHLGAVIVTSGSPTLAAFTAAQLDAAAYTLVRLHSRGIQVAQVFWGLWLIPYAMVIRRSGWIPAWIGAPLFAAGVGYVAASISALFFPDAARALSPLFLVLAMGELPILVWLVVWGAREVRA